jgi:dihydroflavonol-4-reductase
MNGPLPEGRDCYDERDWSDPSALDPYPKSKVIAEKAAWEFIKKEGGKLELTAVLPSLVFGPPLSSDYSSSLNLLKGILGGMFPPTQSLTLCDVRDVAIIEVKALTAPKAAGQRIGVGIGGL